MPLTRLDSLIDLTLILGDRPRSISIVQGDRPRSVLQIRAIALIPQ
ncbi:MAG: hypothetical protein VKL39_14275 [Leptolyngbyaceae bacterium]|nr:hypothetical protein [Leptolyngbyaceae bacterium]